MAYQPFSSLLNAELSHFDKRFKLCGYKTVLI